MHPSATALQALVDRAVPGSTVRSCRPLTGGVSAITHAVCVDLPGGGRRQVVVRRHTNGADPTGRQTSREYALLSALMRLGIPVPEPLFVDVSRMVLPSPYLVVAFVEGSTTLPDGAGTVRAMAAMLGRIHAIGGGDGLALPLRIDPAPELSQWLVGHPQAAPLQRRLRAEDWTYGGHPALLHGDYWPGNVLWANGRIAAVLDWEDAALGDPLSDIAGARVELWCALGPKAATAFTRCLSDRVPMVPQRLAVWDMYVSSAALRFMGGWGLPADDLAHRRQRTAEFMEHAIARFMML